MATKILITGNSADYGGGIYVSKGTLLINGQELSILNNIATSYGGGIYVDINVRFYTSLNGFLISGNKFYHYIKIDYLRLLQQYYLLF